MHPSLDQPVDDERADPLAWSLSFRIPLALFEAYVGDIKSLSGRSWAANFYKCADDSSHPHWGFWADIGPRLDFHQPEHFGTIVFE